MAAKKKAATKKDAKPVSCVVALKARKRGLKNFSVAILYEDDGLKHGVVKAKTAQEAYVLFHDACTDRSLKDDEHEAWLLEALKASLKTIKGKIVDEVSVLEIGK
jgi:hypothetical protein